MRKVHFKKMHGNGNDFVVIEASRSTPPPDATRIRALADRRTGIGFDQLLWITADESGDADAAYRIFNADGGEVEQCGNGVRCIARALADERGSEAPMRLASPAGIVAASFGPDGVSVAMGVPDFEPANVPFRPAASRGDEFLVETPIGELAASVLSLGNPHAVIRVASVDEAPVGEVGAALQGHAAFPARVNVGFLEIVDRTHGRLRVFERGVGETAACGTGACAAMVAGRRLGLFDERVSLELPGGELVVSWRGPGEQVWLTGPAVTAFEGTVTL